MFPKIMVPQNGWFIRGNPIKMDDLWVFPYFWVDTHMYTSFLQFRSFLFLKPARFVVPPCLRLIGSTSSAAALGLHATKAGIVLLQRFTTWVAILLVTFLGWLSDLLERLLVTSN